MEKYYEILGVSEQASAEEIKRAYKKLVLKYHPDRYKGDKKEGEKQFNKIQEAYNFLIDTGQRSQNDIFDADGIFSSFFKGVGINFDTYVRQRGGRTRNRSSCGENVFVKVFITLEELTQKDLIKTITYEKNKKCDSCHGEGIKDGRNRSKCDRCDGTGFVVTENRSRSIFFKSRSTCSSCGGAGTVISDIDKCERCNGYGFVSGECNFIFHVPYAVKDETVIRVSGRGGCGIGNAPPGDLFVHIHYEDHDIFDVLDNDLLVKYNLSLDQAISGCEIDIPTLYKNFVKIKLHSGVQPGTKIIKKRYGLPINRNESGDLVVHFNVIIPKKERVSHEFMHVLESISNNDDNNLGICYINQGKKYDEEEY
ncbi:MAG: DnaJ C-terminal domain-containing protein [Elusimicrobiota bacterium]